MKTISVLLLTLATAALASPVQQPDVAGDGIVIGSRGLEKRLMCNNLRCFICKWIDNPEYCEDRYNLLVAGGDGATPTNTTMKA